MSTLTDDGEALAHYGILGMHWGIRKDERQLRRADKAWAKGATTRKAWTQDYNTMAAQMNNEELDRINNDPRFRGQDVKSHGPLRDSYHAEVANTATRILNEASRERLGPSPSGELYVDWEMPANLQGYPRMRLVDNRIEHADTPEDATITEIKIEWDDLGHILKLTFPDMPKALVQSDLTMAEIIDGLTDEEAEEVLAHYGVLGMHWGIRKAVKSANNDTRSTRRALASLDNDELRATVERMRLEKQYREIADTSTTTKVVRLIGKHGGTIVASAASATAAHLVKRALNQRYPKSDADAAARSVAEVSANRNKAWGPYAGRTRL